MILAIENGHATMHMCGVAQPLGGGARECRWPEDTLRYCIRDQHPRVSKDVWEGEIEWSLGELAKVIDLTFERVDRLEAAQIVYTVANLGGPGGVLADAMLVPCGVRRNLDFQSIVRVDALDNYAAEDRSRVAMTFDLGEVLLHEAGHVLGLYHIETPGVVALLNPRYNPSIGGLQPPDIEALVRIGYRRRREQPDVPSPPAGVPLGETVDVRYLPPGTALQTTKRSWLLEEL